jgi:APA family basic amino acid/polyamine antiporter
MLGAGIFSALAPAAQSAGSWLLMALAVAAVVAYCNATCSARLAARYPTSGGTYVYGRERLGPFWGYLAGWSFVVGKAASCAAMALTVGSYLWPDRANVIAAATVIAVTALSAAGVQKAAWLTRGIVVFVLAVLAMVVIVCSTSPGTGSADQSTTPVTTWGVLQGAGLLFFAFAGYARIATLSEEVKDPARTIRRAVPLALGITLAVYATVAVAVLSVLGAAGLAASVDPLAQAVRTAGASELSGVVRVGATVAAAGALLALLLGVSRTVLAMARDRYLPGALTRVRAGTPLAAELTVGAIVAVLAAGVDVRGAIGFSSFGVLLYYAIANASAWNLRGNRGPARVVPAVGLVGCLLLCASVPLASLIAGIGVTVLGAAVFAVQRQIRGRPRSSR